MCHKVMKAKILSNSEIYSMTNVFKMQIELPKDYPMPHPGQFVNIYLNDSSRLLPRPLSVCDYETGLLTLVYAIVGEGTKILSSYGHGDRVRLSTPLGKGYNISVPAIIIGGGLGIPPMLYLAKSLPDAQAQILLGYRSSTFLKEDFPQTMQVHIATDDGSAGFKGTVLDVLKKLDIKDSQSKIYACGPRPMLKALCDYASEKNIAIEVSLEERMGCGYGACVGCTCKTIKGQRKVCEDGPVFNGMEVQW